MLALIATTLFPVLSFTQTCNSCCLTDVDISSNFTHINGDYQSNTWIKSDAFVEATSSDFYGAAIDYYPTTYSAVQYVELNAGFVADATVEFAAEITNPCTATVGCDAIADYPWIASELTDTANVYYDVDKCIYNGLGIVTIVSAEFPDVDYSYFRLDGDRFCFEWNYLLYYGSYNGCSINTTDCISLD